MKDFKEFFAKIEEHIKKSGFSVIATVTSEDEDAISMAYTVGLSDKGHPELIMFGLNHEIMHALLTNAAKRLMEGQLAIGELNSEIAQVPMMVAAVDPSIAKDYIFKANERASKELPALQIVWPDQNELFPWDKNFNQSMVNYQKILIVPMALKPKLH